jgi:hypothetical protein
LVKLKWRAAAENASKAWVDGVARRMVQLREFDSQS